MKMCINVVLFILLFSSTLLATWQIPDVLIHEGKEYSIYNELLDPYFKKYPERNPKDENYMCSANWRGYRATFEISNGDLRLKDIVKNACGDSTASELTKAVPGGKPLKIDWYTGVLTSMDGENPGDSYSMEFLYSFERYSVFEIAEGRLSIARHFDNEGFKIFKKEQFDKYKKSDEYREKIKQATSDGRQANKEAEESIGFWFPFSLKKIL
jgi:hypothetical protein